MDVVGARLKLKDHSKGVWDAFSDDEVPIEALEAEVLALARAALSGTANFHGDGNKALALELNATLHNQMFAELHNRSMKDKENLKTSRDAVLACAVDHLEKKSSVDKQAELGTSFTSTTKSHNDCRKIEISLKEIWNKKKNNEYMARKIKEKLCGVVKTFQQSRSNQGWCNPPFGKATAAWVRTKKNVYHLKVKQYDKNVRDCDSATKYWNKMLEEFQTATEKLTEKKKKCDGLQDSAMDDQCKLLKSQRSSNTNFESCYQPALNTYEADVYHVLQNVKKRKLEWRTLERIGCLIAIIASNVNADTMKDQLDICIMKEYDGHQMHITPAKAPRKRTKISEKPSPCFARSARLFWAPSVFPRDFLKDCLSCPLAKTSKPTPSPTPPPPPPKFKCNFNARDKLVHVRYGGYYQRIGNPNWRQWKTPLFFEEINETAEMEVMVSRTNSRPELRYSCRYVRGKTKSARWQTSSAYNLPLAIASFGKTFDEALTAPTYWTRRKNYEGWYLYPTVWGNAGYANFVMAPYCNVQCKVKVDDELKNIQYNGRAVPVQNVYKNGREKTAKWWAGRLNFDRWKFDKRFCFKYVKGAKLDVEGYNWQKRGACGWSGGFSLSCKSNYAAWNRVSTNTVSRYDVYSKTQAGGTYAKVSQDNICETRKSTRIDGKRGVWDRRKFYRYLKLTFKDAS